MPRHLEEEDATTMFVIKREDGKYLSAPDSYHGHLWTKDLQRATTFPSRGLAAVNLCPENETAVSMEEEMTAHE